MIAIDKNVLIDYIDICELVKETENEIAKLRARRTSMVQDTVSGSNPEFPYEPRTFKVEGTTYSYTDDVRLIQVEHILDQRINDLQHKKLEVEEWLNTITPRMQRIIRYRIFEGMPWERVADKMGRNCTGESVRRELSRFLEN